MASEKLRYLLARAVPAEPLVDRELAAALRSTPSSEVMELLLARSYSDPILRRALQVRIFLLQPECDLVRAKAAIDYALFFPEYVRYSDKGHELILDAVTDALPYVAEQKGREFAIEVAIYALLSVEAVRESFEDGWAWQLAVERLDTCLSELKA